MTQGAYPSLTVRFMFEDNTREVAALIDTGFDGYLVVPRQLVSLLREPFYRRRMVTASSEVVVAPAFPVAIELADVPGRFDAMAVALGDEYLVGLLSINRIRLTLDHGTRVVVEP